jgi:hypothetical protein
MIVMAYVDDCIMINLKEHHNTCKKLVKTFNDKYEITDKGELSWHLGVAYLRDSKKGLLFAHQGNLKSITDIPERYGMQNCKPKKMPLPPGMKTYKSTEDNKCTPEDHSVYCSIVGSLQYLSTMTRVDIAYATSELSRYLVYTWTVRAQSTCDLQSTYLPTSRGPHDGAHVQVGRGGCAHWILQRSLGK